MARGRPFRLLGAWAGPARRQRGQGLPPHVDRRMRCKLLAVGTKSLNTSVRASISSWRGQRAPIPCGGALEARRTSGVPPLSPRAGWRLDLAKPSSWSTIVPDSLDVLQEPPEKSFGEWGRLPASRTKRETQPPRAWPARIAHLPRATCGALGGAVSEGSRPGRRVASWGAGAHRGESCSAGPPMPPARHCTRQTRPQRGPGPRLLRAPRPCGQQAVCACLCACATYVREIHRRAVRGHAWLVSAAGGAARWADGRGFPPPLLPSTHPSGFRSTRGG